MPILKRNGKTFSGTPTKVDTAKSYTTFDSADAKNPTTWSDVELLTSKEEQRSLFSKISTMFKNIRYLYKMLGTTDISHYSDGTVTGAIKSACDNSDSNKESIDAVNSKLGNTDISAIGNGTVTGSVKTLSDKATENEAAISEVNSKLGNTDISAIGDGTVTGGLNALNSNLIIERVEFIPSIFAYKVGHTLEIYKHLSGLDEGTYIKLGITQYKPVNDYAIIPLYSASPPYLVVGSFWISSTGNVEIYKHS